LIAGTVEEHLILLSTGDWSGLSLETHFDGEVVTALLMNEHCTYSLRSETLQGLFSGQNKWRNRTADP